MPTITDKHGNTADTEYWGSEEAARASLATLKHCRACRNCSYCSYCSYCSDCSRCSYCLEGFIHGVMGGYGWWVDPKTGRARVGCQERDDWETLTREQVSTLAHDAADWYDRYWAAWLSIIANNIN